MSRTMFQESRGRSRRSHRRRPWPHACGQASTAGVSTTGWTSAMSC